MIQYIDVKSASVVLKRCHNNTPKNRQATCAILSEQKGKQDGEGGSCKCVREKGDFRMIATLKSAVDVVVM